MNKIKNVKHPQEKRKRKRKTLVSMSGWLTLDRLLGVDRTIPIQILSLKP